MSSKCWSPAPSAFPACPLGAQRVLLCVSQVKDEQHQCSLGNLKIPLSQLLTSEDMTLNQRFQLSNSGSNSSLKMKLALRVPCLPQGAEREGWGAGRSGSGPGRGGRPQGIGRVRAEITVPTPCRGWREGAVWRRGLSCNVVAAQGEMAEAPTQMCNSSGVSRLLEPRCCSPATQIQLMGFLSFSPESITVWISEIFC